MKLPEINENGYFFQDNDQKEIEIFVGIEAYSTSEFQGISGIYKHSLKDFIVKEITSSGKVLEMKENYPPQPFLTKFDRFTTFNLVKSNKDTFKAIRDISRYLRVSPNLFHYAGLKDRSSISVQKVSIKGDFVDQLKRMKLRDIFIRSITPTKKPVRLGGNRGNNFIIVIRNIKNKDNLKENIEKLFKDLTSRGFPNYFGIQRFGQYRPNSHSVGRYILEDDYEKAYNEFVTVVYSTESPRLQTIRRNIKKEPNLEKALELLPTSLYYERSLIKHLIENPGEYKNAFETLQTDLKNLLISAFQSFIFNKMISLRVKRGFNLIKPVKGDAISILDEENGHVTKIKYVYGDLNGNYDKYLDKALKLNRAAIVVPIIGYNSNLDEFPLMKTFFEEIIQQEGIDVKVFDNQYLYDFEFKGAYRSMIIKPQGLKIIEFEDDDLFPGKKKLKFEVSLPKGTYATLLLREIMK